MRWRYIGPNAQLLAVRGPLADGRRWEGTPDAAGEFDAPDDWRLDAALAGARDMATGAPLYARLGAPPAPGRPTGGVEFVYAGPAAGPVLLRLRHADGSRHEYSITAGAPFAVADAAAIRALDGDTKYRRVSG